MIYLWNFNVIMWIRSVYNVIKWGSLYRKIVDLSCSRKFVNKTWDLSTKKAILSSVLSSSSKSAPIYFLSKTKTSLKPCTNSGLLILFICSLKSKKQSKWTEFTWKWQKIMSTHINTENSTDLTKLSRKNCCSKKGFTSSSYKAKQRKLFQVRKGKNTGWVIYKYCCWSSPR